MTQKKEGPLQRDRNELTWRSQRLWRFNSHAILASFLAFTHLTLMGGEAFSIEALSSEPELALADNTVGWGFAPAVPIASEQTIPIMITGVGVFDEGGDGLANAH